MSEYPFDPATERYVSLATYRRDGREVRTPIWIAGSDGVYYLFSAGEAGKVKRIRFNGCARIAACDALGRVRGGWLDGWASVVWDAAEIERAYGALRRKYGWQMRAGDFLSRLSGRYERRAVIALRLAADGDGWASRWCPSTLDAAGEER